MSTIAEIGFWPKEIIFSFNQSGLSAFFTPVIKQLPNAVHAWFFSFKILTLTVCIPFLFNFCSFCFFNVPAPAAARSLAIPLMPKQSALFGVIEISIILKLLFGK